MRYFIGLILLITVSANCRKNKTASPQPEPNLPSPKHSAKLTADGPGNTYELIDSVLGGNATEDPDCDHPSFGRHIREEFDNTLNKYVFVFTLHVTPDNDRCNGATDRQRNEIKTYGPSPDSLKGQINETVP